jgi:hypothetical protein
MQQRLIVTMASRMLPSLLHRYCDHATGLLDSMSVKRPVSLPVVVPTVVLPTYQRLDSTSSNSCTINYNLTCTQPRTG